MGEFDGVVECRLDPGLVGGNPCGPRHGDTRERLGDKEAVPGVSLPGPVRVDVEGTDGGIDESGQLDDAGFGDLGGTAGTVGGDGAVMASEVGALQIAQAGCAIAGAGASNGHEAETLYGAGDKFTIEATADEDGHAVVTEAPGGGEQATMPEGVDGRGRGIVAGQGVGVADVFVTKSDAEAADGGAHDAGNDVEGEALLHGVGVGHEDEFTFSCLVPAFGFQDNSVASVQQPVEAIPQSLS